MRTVGCVYDGDLTVPLFVNACLDRHRPFGGARRSRGRRWVCFGAGVFHSAALTVRGVSVVFGNAPLDESFPIAQHLVKDFGPPRLRTFRGAGSAGQLGTETEGSRAIAAALRRERLTILMLGPATNVATVLRNHPELAQRIVA